MPAEKLDLACVKIEKHDAQKKSMAVHFHYFLEMKRRLDGIFHMSNSHVILHFETKRIVMEVFDSEKEGLCLFVIGAQEFSYTGRGAVDVGCLSLAMDAWRIIAELVSKRMTGRKRNLTLRIEFGEENKTYKFGVLNSDTREYSYTLEQERYPLSLYKTNPLLEPTRYAIRVCLQCPMELDRICKDACAFDDSMKISASCTCLNITTGAKSTPVKSDISWTLPIEEGLMRMESGVRKQAPDGYDMPLRLLRVITRFCNKADRIVLYLDRPLTLVAKRKKNIVWTLRLKGEAQKKS